MTFLSAMGVLSGVAFVIYGVTCIGSGSMKQEFERWNLGGFRVLVGTLEVLGGIGLLIGPRLPLIHSISAGGLCLLMALGLGVRLKSRDGLLVSIPAAALMLINGYIFLRSIAG